MDTPRRRRMIFSVSMNRIVQRSAAVFKARVPFAGLSPCVRPDAFPFLKPAALIPTLWTDAAFAATTPARANDLAV